MLDNAWKISMHFVKLPQMNTEHIMSVRICPASCCFLSPSGFVLPCQAPDTHLHCICSHPAVPYSFDDFLEHKNHSYTHTAFVSYFYQIHWSLEECQGLLPFHGRTLFVHLFGLNHPFALTTSWGPVSSFFVTITKTKGMIFNHSINYSKLAKRLSMMKR